MGDCACQLVSYKIVAGTHGEMRVDGRGETVVAVRLLGHTARAEVLRREHTPGRHDPDEGVELGLFGVLPRVSTASRSRERFETYHTLVH